MRSWAFLMAAPLLLAQGRARRPQRVPAPADGGVGIAIHVSTDGGGESDGGVATGPADVEQLRREVRELSSRTAALEQEAARGRAQQQQLQQISADLAALRQQLAQGQQQQQAAQEQAAAQRDDTQRAISGLLSVQDALAGGNLDVDAALSEAMGSLPPQAQRELAAARDAIRNRDLYNARAHVAQALSIAQQGR